MRCNDGAELPHTSRLQVFRQVICTTLQNLYLQ